MTYTDADLRRAFAGTTMPTDGEPTAEEIRMLLDGEGDEATRLATLARLMSTPEGRRELDMLRALREGFSDVGTTVDQPIIDTPDPTVEIVFPTRRVRPIPQWVRPFGVAAALLIVTLLGVQQFVSRSQPPVFRSGAAELTLVSPQDDAHLSGPPTFLWRSVAGASYELEVYTADGREIAQQVTRDTLVRLPAALTSGDYRWWVTAALEDGTQARSATRRVRVR
jgi:hypothetical protein